MDIGARCDDLKMSDGASIALWRKQPPVRKENLRLIFSHGTGFASEAFAPFLSQLAARFEVISFDMRAHGKSGGRNIETLTHDRLCADFIEIVHNLKTRLGTAPLYGAFHSISAVAAFRAELTSPGLFGGIIGYEPPLMRSGDDRDMSTEDSRRMAAGARKRRAVFESSQDLADRFQRRFSNEADEDAAIIAARALLQKQDDARYSLRCPTDFEARLYETNQPFGLWERLSSLQCPVTIMAGRRAKGSDYTADVAPLVASAGGFDLVQLSDLSHLGWIEAPRRTAKAVIDAIERQATFISD